VEGVVRGNPWEGNLMLQIITADNPAPPDPRQVRLAAWETFKQALNEYMTSVTDHQDPCKTATLGAAYSILEEALKR
jgi:hypothetical protein